MFAYVALVKLVISECIEIKPLRITMKYKVVCENTMHIFNIPLDNSNNNKKWNI